MRELQRRPRCRILTCNFCKESDRYPKGSEERFDGSFNTKTFQHNVQNRSARARLVVATWWIGDKALASLVEPSQSGVSATPVLPHTVTCAPAADPMSSLSTDAVLPMNVLDCAFNTLLLTAYTAPPVWAELLTKLEFCNTALPEVYTAPPCKDAEQLRKVDSSTLSVPALTMAPPTPSACRRRSPTSSRLAVLVPADVLRPIACGE